jgi:hypothetical protein
MQSLQKTVMEKFAPVISEATIFQFVKKILAFFSAGT